jgi:hypothetical protein
MNQEPPIQRFCQQREKFNELFQPVFRKDWNAASAKTPSHAISLAFAEQLILCPNEGAVVKLIQRNPADARIFLISADRMDVVINNRVIDFLKRPTQNDTPFYVLGSAVKEYLEDVRESYPELWQT